MKNLLDQLKFNGAHMDDKKALTLGQLQNLSDAKYSDQGIADAMAYQWGGK